MKPYIPPCNLIHPEHSKDCQLDNHKSGECLINQALVFATNIEVRREEKGEIKGKDNNQEVREGKEYKTVKVGRV
jgi:hypothetical protein